MTLFLSTMNQMAFLLLLIAIGYILYKVKAVPENASASLSKMENNVFIPALVLGTFIENFTTAKLTVAWQFLLAGFIVVGISIPLAIIASKCCTKDSYLRKIYTYGLSFSNFGFMGNAVVKALFPEIFMEYLIFTLPFWMLIYVWGVPALLIPSEGGQQGLKDRLKSFLNPMFIAMLVGMIVGLLSPTLPNFINTAVSSLGNCMSPVAMLLTGMTIAKIDLKRTFKTFSLYLVSFLRLVALPLLTILVLVFLRLPYELAICAVCAQAMPLGLSPIVVPAGYGMDTTDAAGMTLISHLLSCITIPLIFMLFNFVIK